jgi:hypothetical protein
MAHSPFDPQDSDTPQEVTQGTAGSPTGNHSANGTDTWDPTGHQQQHANPFDLMMPYPQDAVTALGPRPTVRGTVGGPRSILGAITGMGQNADMQKQQKWDADYAAIMAPYKDSQWRAMQQAQWAEHTDLNKAMLQYYGKVNPANIRAENASSIADERNKTATDIATNKGITAEDVANIVARSRDSGNVAKGWEFQTAPDGTMWRVNKTTGEASQIQNVPKGMTTEPKGGAVGAAQKGVPKLSERFQSLQSASGALDEVEQMLNDPKNKDLIGPFAGRINAMNPLRSADSQALQTQFGLSVARAIAALKAGARGFGPQERPFFEQLSEMTKHTIPQNLAILGRWRSYIANERQTLMDQAKAQGIDPATFAPQMGGTAGAAAPQSTTNSDPLGIR